MFIRPSDLGAEDEWRPFLDAHPFGELVAVGRGRDVAVVVPTQFVVAGDEILLHLVAGNPVWPAVDENPKVLLAVSGDWAYIPSDWKAIGGEDPAWGIPTTYYASVQVIGTASVLEEPLQISEVLRGQLDALQPGVETVDPIEHGEKLGAIRAMKIRIDSVRAKFKYGGNVDAAHRGAVIEHLEERAAPGDGAAAAHARRRSTVDPG